jgi:hypothetical protein
MFGTALLIVTLRVLSNAGPNTQRRRRTTDRGAPSGGTDQALIG